MDDAVNYYKINTKLDCLAKFKHLLVHLPHI